MSMKAKEYKIQTSCMFRADHLDFLKKVSEKEGFRDVRSSILEVLIDKAIANPSLCKPSSSSA